MATWTQRLWSYCRRSDNRWFLSDQRVGSLHSVDLQYKGRICILGGVEQGSVRFHHATQKGTQFKMCELFISGIFHFIFLCRDWPWVTETMYWWNHCLFYNSNSLSGLSLSRYSQRSSLIVIGLKKCRFHERMQRPTCTGEAQRTQGERLLDTMVFPETWVLSLTSLCYSLHPISHQDLPVFSLLHIFLV